MGLTTCRLRAWGRRWAGGPRVLVVLVTATIFGGLEAGWPLEASPQARAVGVQATAGRPVVVASKPFAESFILAEMFAQLLDARGFTVDRRPGLGATEIAFGALRNGDIDVYPEYTGTGLLAVLGESPPGESSAAFERVATVFAERWGVRWLPPLGFENTYAIAVRPATADSLELSTLTDLARVASRLRAGLTPDFIGRADGLPGLEEAYGIVPGEVRALLQAVKYQALVDGAVDVIDGYGTDGQIARYGLRVLQDDLGFFPPYDAAALVSAEVAREVNAHAHERGLHFIDAPVSGGEAGAQNGALTVMCGGEHGAFEAARPVIDAFARAVTLMGPVGAGQLTKMVNQICIAGLLQGLSEGMNFGRKAGLDMEKVIDVIGKGAAQSWQMDNRAATMCKGEFDFGFAVDWMRKDLGICLAEAKNNGARLPITALVDQLYGQVQARGGQRWDTSSLMHLLIKD